MWWKKLILCLYILTIGFIYFCLTMISNSDYHRKFLINNMTLSLIIVGILLIILVIFVKYNTADGFIGDIRA